MKKPAEPIPVPGARCSYVAVAFAIRVAVPPLTPSCCAVSCRRARATHTSEEGEEAATVGIWGSKNKNFPHVREEASLTGLLDP